MGRGKYSSAQFLAILKEQEAGPLPNLRHGLEFIYDHFTKGSSEVSFRCLTVLDLGLRIARTFLRFFFSHD